RPRGPGGARDSPLAQPRERQDRHHGHARPQGGRVRLPADSPGEGRTHRLTRTAFRPARSARPPRPMTLPGFVLRNALRNKRRALLSTVSVAASLFLLVLLQTFQREFTLPPADVGASLRIAVRNK